jgi:hypothetical protein
MIESCGFVSLSLSLGYRSIMGLWERKWTAQHRFFSYGTNCSFALLIAFILYVWALYGCIPLLCQ